MPYSHRWGALGTIESTSTHSLFGSDCGGAWKGETYEGEGDLGKSSQIFVDSLDLTVLGYSPVLVCQCKRLWRETQCGRARDEVPNEQSSYYQPI